MTCVENLLPLSSKCTSALVKSCCDDSYYSLEDLILCGPVDKPCSFCICFCIPYGFVIDLLCLPCSIIDRIKQNSVAPEEEIQQP
jgi:hypothetical protein